MAIPQGASRVRVHGLADVVARLKNLPQELSGKNGGPIRRALFQAAKIIEEEARTRAIPFDDPKTESQVFKAVKKWREKNPRAYEGQPTEIYHVGVDGRKAPHWHFLELGTVKQPAQSYLRTGFEAKKEDAVRKFVEVLGKDVAKLERGAR